MPGANKLTLSPIEEVEEVDQIWTPAETMAWQCCMCDSPNNLSDDNYAWFNGIPEYCVNSDCRHQRCLKCYDPGPKYWPLQYTSDGQSIQRLFRELEISVDNREVNEEDDTIIESESESGSESDASTIFEVSSDEGSGIASYSGMTRRSTSPGPGDLGGTHYCPLRESRFCSKMFESAAAAWRHSRVHIADETIRCANKDCSRTFTGKGEMRLHYVARHS